MKLKSLKLVGVLALSFSISVSGVTLYVDLNSTNAMLPYSDWSTAATNIQDAIDAASPMDQVLVTNGVYRSGARLITGVATTNRVAVTKAITVQSINGPSVTTIEGYQVPGTTNGSSAIRCVYLANGAVLTGFTLTYGATGTTADNGGGVWFQTLLPTTTSIVSNCVLTGNSAGFGGGGAYGSGTLINCTLSSNWGRLYAGGAYGCKLVGCILKGNWTDGSGGGSGGCVLTNCVLTANWARRNGGGSYGEKLINCT
ncbi:MAG: hypothetical protein M3Y82_10320, partial [Verrucomicrobiota bacterium]|nr:hypothetical protein [Verrucomicrobiota bacterium]